MSVDNIIQVLTVALAAFATAGAWLAYRANRRSALADEGQLRLLEQQVLTASSPRIYVDGVTASNFEPGREPVFFLRIDNAGPVPAERVSVFVEIEHVHGSTRPAQPNTVLIPANGYRQYDFRSSFVLPVDLNELEGWNLRVRGTVDHAGQTTPFCYKYNHWPYGQRPDGVSLFVPCDFDQRRHAAVRMTGTLNLSGALSATVIRGPHNPSPPETGE